MRAHRTALHDGEVLEGCFPFFGRQGLFVEPPHQGVDKTAEAETEHKQDRDNHYRLWYTKTGLDDQPGFLESRM
jgi:hypothetical protein